MIALSLDLGAVEAAPVKANATIAYDDVFAIEYFQRKLRPYWRRYNRTATWRRRVVRGSVSRSIHA